MNRCFPRLRATLCLLTLMGMLALSCFSALAQVTGRAFPPKAVRGILHVTTPPLVLLNGQPARLSPGARIRNTHNLIVLSASLVGQELLVNYLADAQGMLHEVWILTPGEAQQEHPGREPAGSIQFGAETISGPSGH